MKQFDEFIGHLMDWLHDVPFRNELFTMVLDYNAEEMVSDISLKSNEYGYGTRVLVADSLVVQEWEHDQLKEFVHWLMMQMVVAIFKAEIEVRI